MKDGLIARLTTEKNPNAALIIEQMRSILQDKQTAYRMAHARTPMLLTSQPIYAEIAALLEKPLKIAKNLADLKNALQQEEKLLQDSQSKSKHVSKSALHTLLSDHKNDIELLKVQLKNLEKRNGELSKEIDNPPQKQIEALQKKMDACNKSIQSLGELISQLDNSDRDIKRVMDQINQRVRERDETEGQLKALKEAKGSDPKVEQKQVREQMIALRKTITDKNNMSSEAIIAVRQEKLTTKQAEVQTQQSALNDSISAVRKTRGVNNETNDLLREGQTRISELHVKAGKTQHFLNRSKM